MTLREVAAELARRMNCEVLPGEDPYSVQIQGKGYHVVLAPFFGGWQATLHAVGMEPATYYAEAVEMLELRLKGKLTGRPIDK